MKIFAIILSSGIGSRMSNNKTPKQYLLLNNKPIILHSLEKFQSHPLITHIIVAIRKEDEKIYKNIANDIPYIYGGKTRHESAKAAIASISDAEDGDLVLIHDAARPFFSHKTIDQLITAINSGYVAAAGGLRISETVKRIDKSDDILETMKRDELVRIQTPQIFCYGDLISAIAKAKGDFTDELALFDGEKIKMIDGEEENIKITTNSDYQKLTERRLTDIRFASGFDVHAFDKTSENHIIKVGGVSVPSKYKLLAHSDGDVVIHALCDAIFGAISAGDIGEHFPPTDQRYKNADSSLFLKYACDMIKMRNGIVNNVDITIIAETPKLMEYKPKIKQKIAELMRINENRIGIKATTTEGLGFLGRGDGVAALVNISIIVGE